MRKIIVFLMILLFTVNPSYAKQLRFVQFTDCHLTSNGYDFRGKSDDDPAQILGAAVESVNKLKDVDFVIFSGDNIDAASKKTLKLFCEITKNVNKPYYITLGNHDVSMYQGLDKIDYMRIVRKYDKYQNSHDPYYYFFPNNDIIVIVMDGVHEAIPNTHGSYSDEDLAWLDGVLSKNKDKMAVIIQHFPLVEPYTKKSHRLLDTEAYWNLLGRHKNIIALVSGHYHAGKVTLKDGIYHISSPAFINSPHQYRIIEIDYDKNFMSDETPKFDLKTELFPPDGSGS